MKRLLLASAALVLVVAKPELYREKEDFQYARSSTDEGSKSGFYGAQRGNMGGNYERAHNMDLLAQHQMSGLVKQVEGELGDGANTRSGSVFTSGNSRGVYGSGRYDLSAVKGRSFDETESARAYDQSSSMSAQKYRYQTAQALIENNNNAIALDHLLSGDRDKVLGYAPQGSVILHRKSKNSLHNNGQAYNSRQESRESVESAAYFNGQSYIPKEEVMGYSNREPPTRSPATQSVQNNNPHAIYQVPSKPNSVGYTGQGDYQSGYRSQAVYDSQDYAKSHINYNTDNYGTNVKTHVIAGEPARIVIRPGSTVTVPIAAQVYDANQVSSAGDQNNIHSEAEVLNSVAPHSTVPVSGSKQYESSYSYRKEWEKHHASPVYWAPVSTSTENPFIANGRLIKSQASHAAADNYQTLHDTQHSASSSVKSASQYSAFDANYRTNNRNLNLSKGHTQTHSDNEDDMVVADTKPKSYHSSYSYHKAWERQGDPYIIYPTTNNNNEESQKLTSSNVQNQEYSSHQYGSQYAQKNQKYSSYGNVIDCDENGLKRVARSIPQNQYSQWDQNFEGPNVDQNSENLAQSTQSLEDFRQYKQNLEELGHQIQSSYHHSDSLEDLSQQTQNLYDFKKYNQNLEDLRQQTQNLHQNSDNQEELGQQIQHLHEFNQNLEELGQQNENLYQRSDNLEDLGQQTQNLHVFNQNLEYLGQQNQNLNKHSDNVEDLSQQNQNLQGISQYTQNLENRLSQRSDNLADLSQQTQNLQDFSQYNDNLENRLSQRPSGQIQEKWSNEHNQVNLASLLNFNQQTRNDQYPQETWNEQETQQSWKNQPIWNQAEDQQRTQDSWTTSNGQVYNNNNRFDTNNGDRQQYGDNEISATHTNNAWNNAHTFTSHNNEQSHNTQFNSSLWSSSDQQTQQNIDKFYSSYGHNWSLNSVPNDSFEASNKSRTESRNNTSLQSLWDRLNKFHEVSSVSDGEHFNTNKFKENKLQNTDDKINSTYTNESHWVQVTTSSTTLKLTTVETPINESNNFNISPHDIGRGDIGEEELLVPAVADIEPILSYHHVDKPYKTTEEMDSLSLTKVNETNTANFDTNQNGYKINKKEVDQENGELLKVLSIDEQKQIESSHENNNKTKQNSMTVDQGHIIPGSNNNDRQKTDKTRYHVEQNINVEQQFENEESINQGNEKLDQQQQNFWNQNVQDFNQQEQAIWTPNNENRHYGDQQNEKREQQQQNSWSHNLQDFNHHEHSTWKPSHANDDQQTLLHSTLLLENFGQQHKNRNTAHSFQQQSDTQQQESSGKSNYEHSQSQDFYNQRYFGPSEKLSEDSKDLPSIESTQKVQVLESSNKLVQVTTSQPTTEKPGFWKSVGNKFSNAKQKVVLWWNS